MSEADSESEIKFISLFDDLKSRCEDSPEKLVSIAKNNTEIMDLCACLWSLYFEIDLHNHSSSDIFKISINKKFSNCWRDYEERYSDAVEEINFSSDPKYMKYDFNYNINKKYLDKDSDAKYESDSFKDLISCMHIQIECMEKYADEGDEYLIQEEFVERVKPLAQAWTWEGGTWQEAFPVVMQSGIDTWETLKNDHGFDLQGVLRRRKLIPPVLVPRQVAEKEGDARKLSLLNNLREAQQAFIFGAPHAALAFLRSIVEAVLRDYYQAEGKNLAERITNTRGLPAKANKWALRYLRKLANAFLHTAPKSEGNVIDKDAAQFEEMNEKQKEIEMVRLFDIVRALIEGVPRERRQRQADGGVTEP